MISCNVHILKYPFYAQTEYEFTASVLFDIMQQKWHVSYNTAGE